jgi:ketosteroid isomerase-like protein
MASGHYSVATTTAAQPQKYGRRLAVKLLTAIYRAFDEGDLVVAGRLLRTLEAVMEQPADDPGARQNGREQFVAAHERLWTLRHPMSIRHNGDAESTSTQGRATR